jgi:hypothetical protein
MEWMRPRGAALAILPLLLASCAAEDAQIRITRDPALDAAGHAVSIVGVYRDGRLSASYWDEIGPLIARAFGSDGCEAAWGDRLRREAPELYARIDAGARVTGVTDAMLESLAPRADGGLLLILRSSGHPPFKSDISIRIPGLSDEAGAQEGRGDHGGRGSGPKPDEAKDRSVFELSASLYSVRARSTVGRIEMRYTGSTLDGAMLAFQRDFRAMLPNASCVGWR